MSTSKILEFQSKIKVKFNNLDLLKKSLIHKSHDSVNNNEKLEFLGDRVLGLVLSKTLLKNYPTEKEGIIDKKFANLVNKKTCAKVGASLNIIKYMTLGESFKNQNRSDEKIISDGLEALIGAIFLDKGLEISEKFILINWKEHLNKSQITLVDDKTKLQEYCLKKYKKLPKYKVHRQTGPQHSPIFNVEVQIPHSKVYSAVGESKKKLNKMLLKNF